MNMTSRYTLEKKYPLTAGYKENSTSKEAAEKIDSRSTNLRTECLKIVKRQGNYGATPEEVAEILSESILSIRPRFTELKLLQYIIDSGDRRKNSFGSNTKVWRYNDER